MLKEKSFFIEKPPKSQATGFGQKAFTIEKPPKITGGIVGSEIQKEETPIERLMRNWSISETEIKAAPEKTFTQRIIDTIKKPFKIFTVSDTDRKARDSVIYQVKKTYDERYYEGIGKELGLSTDEVKQNIGNLVDKSGESIPTEAISWQEVEKNLPYYTKNLGVRTDPTTQEVVGTMILFPLAMAAIAKPAAVATGVAGFMALSEAESFVISKIQGEEYKAFQQKGLVDLLPSDANEITKDLAYLVDMLWKAKALHTVRQKSPEVIEKFTRDITVKYNIPKKVYIEASKIKSIFQTGEKISAKEMELVKQLGLDASGYKHAIKNGLSIEVPFERIVMTADKPYWAKLKTLFHIQPQAPTIQSQYMSEIKTAPRALLTTPDTSSPVTPYPDLQQLPSPKSIIPSIPATIKETPTPPEKPIQPISKELEPLAIEARKYKSAEEFKKAFLIDINHGKWYHVTDDPNFAIRKGIAPRDFSSMAGGKGVEPGLMITGDLEAEAVQLGRKFVAEIDVSDVPPKFIKQVGRGFGNEVFLPEEILDKVNVKKVITAEEAVKDANRFQKVLDETITGEKQLIDFYNQAKGITPEAQKGVVEAVKPNEGEMYNKLVQNERFGQVKNKLNTQGASSLNQEEISILGKGQNQVIIPSETESIKPLDTQDMVHSEIENLYSGLPLREIGENILISHKGTKRNILDAIGSTLIRYHGLTKETKNALIQMEGSDALRREDIMRFFEKSFPITSAEAELLRDHHENPGAFPIPEELKHYASLSRDLEDLSRRLQEESGLQKNFFPQSFINKNNAKILEHKEIISKLTRDSAIRKHQKEIDRLEKETEALKELQYIPHGSYLSSESIEQHAVKLLSEGKISHWFRDNLSKLKGRKFATLSDAESAGLIPKTKDIRILWASHFEYLYRKLAIHNMIEGFKQNKTATLPESEAPEDWQKVAIAQLDGYKVNPFLVDAIEDFTVNKGSGFWDLLCRPLDALNHLGRSIFFYNPIIMPLWDSIQASGAGTLTPWKPIYSVRLIGQALKDVTKKTELYREAVKRKLYDPAEVGRYAPPIEEAMKVILNKTEKEYPGWKKAIEKITGTPVSWKDALVIPDLYKANWRFVWSVDRVLRTATLRHALNMGMDLDTAVEYANTFHANYNIFTKKSRKALYRFFLVPTYKTAMMVDLPAYIGKNTFELAKNIAQGQEGTPEQKAAASAIIRIALSIAAILGYAYLNGYRLKEGYRLVKKIDPEITDEGKIVTERVITLPGPYFEWFKVLGRADQQGVEGIFMYLAKVPQIAWSLQRNRRWQGDPYYDEGAAPEIQRKQIMISMIKDYIAPIGQYDIMTREEQSAFDNIMSIFGMATYKRGSSEDRILWEINDQKSKLNKYLEKQDVSIEDKQKALDYYTQFVESKVKELEALMEMY